MRCTVCGRRKTRPSFFSYKQQVCRLCVRKTMRHEHEALNTLYDFNRRAQLVPESRYKPSAIREEDGYMFGFDDWNERELYKHDINSLASSANWEVYNARKAALPLDWTDTDKIYMLNYWRYACIICGRKEHLHTDHWVPVSRELNNPGTVPHNLIPLCHVCNKDKGGRNASEWLLSEFGVDAAIRIREGVDAYFLTVRNIDP